MSQEEIENEIKEVQAHHFWFVVFTDRFMSNLFNLLYDMAHSRLYKSACHRSMKILIFLF